jgi:hypothetical protein
LRGMAYGCQTQGLWARDPSLLGLAWPQTPGTWVWDGRQTQVAWVWYGRQIQGT